MDMDLLIILPVGLVVAAIVGVALWRDHKRSRSRPSYSGHQQGVANGSAAGGLANSTRQSQTGGL